MIRNLLRSIVLSILLISSGSVAVAQQVSINDSIATALRDSFTEHTFDSFFKLYSNHVDEKLYIQTDKPYYSAGESIWFKGYLVNAITNTQISATRFIYVELIDRSDSLISRVKVMADSSGFHNSIALAPSLPQGEYVLRGYTQWMRDQDDRFFFSKTIKIANSIDDAVNSKVVYSRDAQNNVVATITMHDQSYAPIANHRMTYAMNVEDKRRRYNVRTDDKGAFSITLPPSAIEGNTKTITLSSDDPARSFDRTIFLPLFDDKLDVQFFPEGGHMIPDHLQMIAFKAIGSDGRSREVTGKLFEDNGTQIVEFATENKGMGKITIMPEAGRKYYAEITDNASGSKHRIDLPQVQTTGCVIKVSQLRGRIYYQIYHTSDIDPSKLGIVIHSRGKIVTAERIEDKLSKTINADYLAEGINQISVIDITTAEPIAQRLFFVNKRSSSAEIATDKNNYERRQLVMLDLNIKDSDGNPAKGSFAMSVTDRNSVEIDTLADNIKSYLLLSSEIKGHVEDPASYFVNDSPKSYAYLDLLMMTQGWTRFDIGDVIKQNIAPGKFAPEVGQTISGEVKGFFGNAAKRPNLLVFDPVSSYFDMFNLGNTNKFTISGFDYPDSTTMIIQAVGRSGSGSNTLTLNITEPTFPTVKSRLARPLLGRHELELPESFLNQSKERYYYEGGMRVIDMEAITVTHDKISQSSGTMYNVTPTKSLNKEFLERFSNMSIFDALRTFAGVNITGETISIRGSQDPPLVYIDNTATDVSELGYLNLMNVESLGIVTGPEAGIFGLGASGGVILVSLKQGSINREIKALPSLAKINHLGYKKPSAFFQPKYELAEKLNDKTPDLRTTICWNPEITTDSTGVAKVSFYTADKASTYDIILEGITEDGQVVRKHTEIKRDEQ